MQKKTMASLPVVSLLLFLLILSRVSNPCEGILNGTVNIGVIVDDTSWVGKVANTALKLAAEDLNDDAHLLNGTRLLLHLRHAQTLLDAAAAASDLLERQVVSIVETQTSEIAAFVSEIGEAAKLPIVSFSDTSPLLSNQRFPYFVRMAHSDGLQMKAIGAVVNHYGWRRIVFVHSDVDFGCGAVSLLSDALRDFGSEIVYISMISSTVERQSIRTELYKLMAIESRVFVVHLPSDVGSNLFNEAQQMGMMEAGYVWITTAGFTSVWDYVLNASTMASMQGLLGIKTHIPNSERLQDFTERWERRFKLDNPNSTSTELSVYGLLAYDALFMIARAIGKMGFNVSFSFSTASSPPLIANGDSIEVFQQGKQLLQEILLTSFTGLSGPIDLHNGEMNASNSSLYEIVNVVGKCYQVVGYWHYKSSKLFKTLPSMGNEGIAPVIWPGRSTKPPRGWELPTNGKRLRIVVPRKAGWQEFVNVTFYPDRNETIVTGFCIDIFKAAVRLLDYELPYDLFLYPDDANSTNWMYNDLVRQVYLKKYDAAVGDITIRAERSEFVEFTQPFTETESVMVAPIMRQEANNAWTFLTPFSPTLWITTAAFVIYTGLVVWFLEHRENPDFRGRPSTQGVTVLWFALSTVFFTHREKIQSSLGRVIIIVWLFVALVLNSSYTASLTSRLTVQKIKTVLGGDYAVGYQGAFVGSFLSHDLGIAHKNLKQFSSRKAYEEALSKGPKNGGVDAIFDEIPYVRAFLSSRCDYSMVGRTYISGGFGFVFPKGSPLAPDISKAILRLSQSREFVEIEAKYFNYSNGICADPREVPKTLDLGNFWGLYLITGSVSFSALIVYFFQALHNFVKDPNATEKQKCVWESFKSFAKYLYREEVSLANYRAESLPENKEGSSEELEHHELVDDAIQETMNSVPSNQINE